jgi:hypothetical protein
VGGGGGLERGRGEEERRGKREGWKVKKISKKKM